jgi:hemolysin III
MTESRLQPAKPRLRGVSHQYAFFVSLACGVGLILAASDGRARVAAGIYATAVSGLLGTSALYHRVTWRPQARRWMRRLDHSMIFVLIAGTYTPVALLALKGTLANVILIVLWAGALGGVIFKLAWIDAPKWLFAAVYVVLGLVSAAVFGELPAAIGWRGDLRERQTEPLAEGLRLPRGLPRARARGRGAAVRGNRLRRAAARLSR